MLWFHVSFPMCIYIDSHIGIRANKKNNIYHDLTVHLTWRIRNFPQIASFQQWFMGWNLPSLKLTVRPCKWMVGILVSFWETLFSGYMWVSGRVLVCFLAKKCHESHLFLLVPADAKHCRLQILSRSQYRRMMSTVAQGLISDEI